MKNIAENNLIRFLNITRRKEGLFANFKAKGTRNGLVFKASFSVDLAAAEVDPSDPLEKIIEECARLAVQEFKKSMDHLQFEGVEISV